MSLVERIVRGVVLPTLAACASHPPAATSQRSDTTSAPANALAAEDAGALRACIFDAKDLAPCIEDCDRGIASACSTVASRAERGDGIPRDITRAVSLHERACELHDALACVTAARMHGTGSGVSPNRSKQMELLSTACKLGDASACSVPARAFASGTGVPRDARRAQDLWERACAGGIETACTAISDAGI